MRVTPVLRSLYGLVSLLAVTVALLLVPATSASAAGEEQDFINRLNALRASAGLPGLTVYGDLTNVARGQSVRMGQQNLLYHNPNLTTEVTNWLSVGENVGYGGSVAAIHDALVNSPGHRANMLSSTFTQVGIGTYFSSTGRLWVTQVFRKPLLALAPQPVGFPLGGAIGATYPAVAGVLGAPTSGEYNVPGGRGQNFQHGEMLWSWGTGAREVHGGILSRYRVLGVLGRRWRFRPPTRTRLPTAGAGTTTSRVARSTGVLRPAPSRSAGASGAPGRDWAGSAVRWAIR